MMKQPCHDGFVIAFDLAVCLRVKCSGYEVFHPKEIAKPLGKFAHKLENVVYEQKYGELRIFGPIDGR